MRAVFAATGPPAPPCRTGRAAIVAAALALLSAPLCGQERLAPASAPADKPAPTPQSLAAEDLAALLEPIRQEREIPALAAAVVRGGKLAAIGAVGVRRVGGAEPVAITDRFHIGSCTKSMTATLCAMLVEEGKLRWDMTIAEAFPDLADRIHSDWLPVTLTQLLCHRSGLAEDRAPGPLFAQLRALDGAMRAQRRKLVELALRLPPEADPGTQFQYSNTGYAIAGAMAEAVADASWEQMLQTRLFAPLGITSAGFGPPGDGQSVDHPWGHTSVGRLAAIRPSPRADNPAVIGPAGTVHLSMIDWAKYAALHLAGARGESGLLAPASFATLHSDPFDQGYGFGWGMVERDWAGGAALQHAGSNSMWWAQIAIAPQRDLAIVIAANRADAAAQRGVKQVLDALIERYAGKRPADGGG